MDRPSQQRDRRPRDADRSVGTPGVLVRPDGVVAWATDITETADTTGFAAVAALEATLRRWTGAPSSSPEHAPVS
ncbi:MULTISPECIES: hypothetical protein [unclassified Streptomyces]|uniref:aromatic-ring hydroxylase C-terminal domain-containing protein n=1 Tax=unclassified Streptomyces TaxID=2593676 RepID=UPI002B1DACF5|nr:MULTISPECIES: hypothetical protein [unclassified Streptomyces]